MLASCNLLAIADTGPLFVIQVGGSTQSRYVENLTCHIITGLCSLFISYVSDNGLWGFRSGDYTVMGSLFLDNTEPRHIALFEINIVVF